MTGEVVDRRVAAMEISPAYVDVAILRWQAETGREAVLDGDGHRFAEVKAERMVPKQRQDLMQRQRRDRSTGLRWWIRPPPKESASRQMR